ncbi:MAG TPA: hypothetical protein VGM03_00820 [Phycisphaerae bacterium]
MNLITMFALLPLLWAADQTPAPSPPDTEIDPRVDRILTAMERAGANVNDLQCRVRYIVENRINLGDVREWQGAILYQKADPHPRFLITFDRSLVGPEAQAPRPVIKKRQWYLLENRWLWIVKEESRQVMKSEVVRPGEHVDFFDINKAPFPFPFGQKKEPLLHQFNVMLAPSAADEPGVDHLVCIPKSGAPAAEHWDKIDYYVLKDLKLPMKIIALEQGGDKETTTIFPDLSSKSINPGLDDRDFAHPKEWKKYGEPIVEPLGGGKTLP